MALSLIPAGGVALAVALGATPVAAMVAVRLGVVDRPGVLKVHTHPVAYLGGVAVLAAMAAGAGWRAGTWLLPLALACGLGLADDLADLDARLRLAAEVAIGAVAGGVLIGASIPAVLVAAAAVAVLVNTVNLLDGLDGLVSGVCLASAIGFAVLDTGRAQVLAVALAGALAGFLVYNRPPARIYLGDAGSYLIGATLACLLVATWFHAAGHPSRAVAAILLVVVPMVDTALAVVRRRRARRPLFTGDRSHLYDQLVTRGWSVARVSIAGALVQAALAGVAIAGARVPVAWAAAMVVGVAAALATLLLAAGFVRPTKETAP